MPHRFTAVPQLLTPLCRRPQSTDGVQPATISLVARTVLLDKRVRGQFDDSRLPVRIASSNDQSSSFNGLLVSRVHAEAAAVGLYSALIPIVVCRSISSFELNLPVPSYQSAGEPVHDSRGSLWVILGVRGIGHTHHVTRELQHSMLKATAGAEKRYAVLASIANALEGAF